MSTRQAEHPAEVQQVEQKPNIAELFMEGAKNGFYIGIEKIAPAMVMAFTIIVFLRITGLLDIIGNLLGPVMAVFGLPGEAIVVLIAAFFAKTAGAATAAMLYGEGVLTAAQATILFPATIVMGTLIGHYVRIVMVSGTNKRWHGLLMLTCVLDAVIAMLLTRVILVFMGLM